MIKNEDMRRAEQATGTAKQILATLPITFLAFALMNFLAGDCPLDGWLNFGVLTSALLLFITTVILMIRSQRGGVVSVIHALPIWFVLLAGVLSVAWMVAAVVVLIS